MPNFIIAGYVWQILGNGVEQAPPPLPIHEQPRKSPSWIELRFPVRDKVLLGNSWQETYDNGFSIIVPWSEGLGRFAKLTRWPEARALVENIDHLRDSYDFCRWTVDCVLKTVDCHFKVVNINKLMLFIFFWKVVSWIMLFHLLF